MQGTVLIQGQIVSASSFPFPVYPLLEFPAVPISDSSVAVMHPLYERANDLSKTVLTAAIEVHRDKGPGLIESIYEWCLIKELELQGIACTSQRVVLIKYKGFTREEPLRFDILVEESLLVEVKAVQEICADSQSASHELHEAP